MTCIIAIRVTPRSSKPGIGVWRVGADGRPELEVRVCAAPSDGEANRAVVKLLSQALAITQGSIEIVTGLNSRHKRVRIERAIEEVSALLPANPGLQNEEKSADSSRNSPDRFDNSTG